MGFIASLGVLIFIFANYSNVVESPSVSDHQLNMVRVKREDIEGYDLGYFHNQQADFNVLYITMKQYLNLSGADQSELDYGFARAEIVTKWPLVAFLGTTLFCLAMSTLLHLCWVRDEKTC